MWRCRLVPGFVACLIACGGGGSGDDPGSAGQAGVSGAANLVDAAGTGGQGGGAEGSGEASSCTSAACPIPLASSLASPWALAIDDTTVYFVLQSDCTVMKVPKSGGTPQRVTSVTYGSPGDRGLAVDSTNVYFTVAGGGGHTSVTKAPKAGGSPTVLIEDIIQPESIAVDATSVYWTSPASGTLMKIPLGGGTAVTLVKEPNGEPDRIALDSTNVYFSDHLDFSSSLKKVALAGGDSATLASGLPGIGDIAVDSTSVYFTTSRGLMKVPLAGGTPVEVASPFGGGTLALDSTTAYGTNGSSGTVMKVPLSGGTPVPLASGQDFPGDIIVDSTSAYWLTHGSFLKPDGAIMKIAK